MRARGLAVHLELAGTGGPDVPAAVGTALVHATREALANVAAHAGTAEAWVTVTPGAAGRVPGVTVRDAGAGFDPARVDPARLGLRRSITERIADWGGRVSVRSAPGQGTVVQHELAHGLPAAGAELVAADSSW